MLPGLSDRLTAGELLFWSFVFLTLFVTLFVTLFIDVHASKITGSCCYS